MLLEEDNGSPNLMEKMKIFLYKTGRHANNVTNFQRY